MATVDGELIEAIRLVPTEVATRAQNIRAIDALQVSEGLISFYSLLVRERMPIGETLIANEIASATVSDAITILAHLYPAQLLLVVEGIAIQQTEAFQRGALLIEKLGLSESLQGAGRYQLTIAQSLKLTVSLGNFFGVDILDELQLDDDLFARVLAQAHLDDSVGIEAVVAPQLLLNVVLQDDIDVTPEMALRMLFNPTLIDGVEIAAGMLEPNGSFTTWVMNTRTGAVTEYADFVFNSFATLGNRYIGASEDGLFELLGDTDDGDDIIARVKGGYLQFGGTQLSRLKEAYIAATGQGSMILRIRTKDGEVYNYGVASTRDGRSTKVHMGKGQRSRYFAFELISAGQDFDLDTLEFVPIVVQRRV